MIHADDGRGFGEPVALDGGVSQASPELFGHAVERGTAGDECPELPSELAMHAPEDPPAMEEMLSFRRLKAPLKILQTALVLQIALNLFFQRLQHARHRHQHRHALAPDSANDFAGLKRILEYHRAAQELRQKYSQELTKHVTQGQQVQEANGMHQRSYFRYFWISVSSGAILPSTLPCVITTPFGSAVVPEVKMISRTSAGPGAAAS